MKNRPRMMFYFDNRPCIDALPDAEAGKLLKGMLRYGQDGGDVPFEGALNLVWLMMKPAIDHDKQRYALICTQKSYAAYCREQARQGLAKLSMEDWQAETHRLTSDDITCNPTSISTSSTSTYSSTSASSSSSAFSTAVSSSSAASPATANSDSKPNMPLKKDARGTYGQKGTVRLTDTEFEELCREMGTRQLQRVMSRAEEYAAGRGYDADTLNWAQYLRFFAKQHPEKP